MAEIVCAGLLFCDVLLKPVDARVFEQDSVRPESLEIRAGGDALNVAVDLAKLGMSKTLSLVGAVGDDPFGEAVMRSLEAGGVSAKRVRCSGSERTGCSIVLIEPGGERHFISDSGANGSLSAREVVAAIQSDTRILHISSLMALPALENDALAELFRFARERGIQTSFDLTFDAEGRWLRKILPGLAYTDTLFVSEEEAYRCFGRAGEYREIAAFFQNKGVGRVVMKLGERGCYVDETGGRTFHLDAFHGNPPVDTTGAGDAFVAAFLFGQASGLTAYECAALGNANGFMATRGIGANQTTATLEELMGFLSESVLPEGLDLAALKGKLEKSNGRRYRKCLSR